MRISVYAWAVILPEEIIKGSLIGQRIPSGYYLVGPQGRLQEELDV
jgi:hypothetical protein